MVFFIKNACFHLLSKTIFDGGRKRFNYNYSRFCKELQENAQSVSGSDFEHFLSLRRILINDNEINYKLSGLKKDFASADSAIGAHNSNIMNRKLR